jgi:5-methylcytosine-specific restriction endonuclease McrA
MSFRLATDDVRKSPAIIKRQLYKNLVCCVDGCGSPISQMTGPGSDVLCRNHQLKQREYGGMGRYDRPHTFHRDWVCNECGYNALEDTRLSEITDEIIKRRIARILMHGDHQERQADGGDDSAQNIRSLCYVCHAKKTIINEDYRK